MSTANPDPRAPLHIEVRSVVPGFKDDFDIVARIDGLWPFLSQAHPKGYPVTTLEQLRTEDSCRVVAISDVHCPDGTIIRTWWEPVREETPS